MTHSSLPLFLPFSLPSHFLAVQVGFDQANYTVVEGEGVVFVRLVMVGRTARPIQVQLSTVDGSAMSKNVNSLIPSPHVTYCKWWSENETKATLSCMKIASFPGSSALEHKH